MRNCCFFFSLFICSHTHRIIKGCERSEETIHHLFGCQFGKSSQCWCSSRTSSSQSTHLTVAHNVCSCRTTGRYGSIKIHIGFFFWEFLPIDIYLSQIPVFLFENLPCFRPTLTVNVSFSDKVACRFQIDECIPRICSDKIGGLIRQFLNKKSYTVPWYTTIRPVPSIGRTVLQKQLAENSPIVFH